MGNLDRGAIKRFTSELSDAGAGPAVIQIAVQVARHVLNTAVEGGALKANPASGVRLPKAAKNEMLFLTPEEIAALANAMTSRQYATLIRLAACTGLRAGEIGALRVGRLDLLRSKLEVVESLADIGGRLVFGPTKTYARRHVPLPPFLRDELGAHLAGQPRDASDLVFCAPKGGPLRHGLFYKRVFSRLLTERGSRSPFGFMISAIHMLLCASPRRQTHTP